ncbi:MAG: HAMP domain-containing histidine kinase [Actinomycetia bacterium]|nr:HAMP domain-containing histidine kinase [Actinomycetes bacterium]
MTIAPVGHGPTVLGAPSPDCDRSEENRRELVQALGHDLRGPCRNISVLVDLLGAETVDPTSEVSRLMGYLEDAAHSLDVRLRGVVDLVSVPPSPGRFEPVDLGRVAERVRTDRAELIRSIGAEVSVGALPAVEGEESQLHRVVDELVANALIYHEPGRGPRVEIAGSQSADEVIVTVTDDGIGFEGRLHDAVFLPLRQLDPSHPHQGPGVGLSVARKIIVGHGGRIWSEASPGSGAVFGFSLPAPMSAAPSSRNR